MSTVVYLEVAVALLLTGAVASFAAARNRRMSGWVSVGFVGAASVCLWAVVAQSFSPHPDPEITLLSIPALGASLAIHVDPLSAIFLAITATVAFLTTLYSVEYMDRFRADGVAKYYPVLQILFAGIVGVVVTADFFFFLVFWELMTLASFFLITFERKNQICQRAGLKYFIVNQAAALGMMAAALILWRQSGSFHFDAFRETLGLMLGSQPFVGHLVLLLFFLGFATKGGILPMGSWLPDAYPAAPSSATAAFGGTMTKLGIYGLLRVFLHLLPLSPATTTWGVLIALAGLGSMFVGTLTALKQDDAKRLMSFHVIGQMGYMFLGIGMGLALLRVDPVLGALGLMAGVFHMLNNSLYKSCLFLGAGAVEYRTGTLSMASLGGLGPLMAVTAACALTASLAIAGVPPLNGFASKWLMYSTGILASPSFPLLAVAVLVAMFISLVTLASFLKYLGGAFLGVPPKGKEIREVPATMIVPQVVLALACVGFGLLPLVPLTYVHRAIVGLPSAATLLGLDSLLGTGPGLEVARAGLDLALWAPLWVALGLAVLGLFTFLGLQRAGGAPVRTVPIWTCGEVEDPEATRYRAGSFYRPFKEAFQGVYPVFQLRLPRFPAWVRKALELDGWLYLPLARGTEWLARSVSRTHVGVLQIYLLWMVLGAVAVLTILLLIGS